MQLSQRDGYLGTKTKDITRQENYRLISSVNTDVIVSSSSKDAQEHHKQVGFLPDANLRTLSHTHGRPDAPPGRRGAAERHSAVSGSRERQAHATTWVLSCSVTDARRDTHGVSVHAAFLQTWNCGRKTHQWPRELGSEERWRMGPEIWQGRGVHTTALVCPNPQSCATRGVRSLDAGSLLTRNTQGGDGSALTLHAGWRWPWGLEAENGAGRGGMECSFDSICDVSVLFLKI